MQMHICRYNYIAPRDGVKKKMDNGETASMYNK